MARQRKMTPERKAFINSLLEHYKPQDTQDVQDMLKDLLGDTLQGMLEAEMDEKLGYSKYDYQNKDTDDSRNGYSKKTVTSSFGSIDLDIPRDRKGEFEPQIVKRTRRISQISKIRFSPLQKNGRTGRWSVNTLSFSWMLSTSTSGKITEPLRRQYMWRLE